MPRDLDAAAKKSLLDRLEADLLSETGLIKDVRFEPLGMDLGLAIYDAQEECVRVNLLHPFYANYSEHYSNPEPFELLAVAEVLTEAYLLEEQVSPESARTILKRRDRFLRELVYSRQLAAPLVAELLQDSAASPAGLEKAVTAALTSLGFEVSPIGGTGEPDGIALARLGIRGEDSGARSDYKITYDAKSSGKDRVQAHTIGAATIARHRNRYDAQHSLVVAPGFAAGGGEGTAVVQEAQANNITLMTISDLVRLVLVAATRQLGFTRLRTLFESSRGPADATAWIDNVMAEQVPEGPLPDILEAIWELQAESPDPVKFAAVRMQRVSLKSYREKEIREWTMSVRRLAGGYVTIDGDVVSLEAPPERILKEVRRQSIKLPQNYQVKPMVSAPAITGDGPEKDEP